MQYYEVVLKRIDALESKEVLMLANFGRFAYVVISSMLYDKDIILLRACMLVFQYFCRPRIYKDKLLNLCFHHIHLAGIMFFSLQS